LCGAHIVFPWRPIDDGSGTYNWSSVETAIAPWAKAGKQVGLTFAGVDETFGAEGRTNALLATPDYVMKQVHVVTCAPTTVKGNTKDVPPTPVYWEPGYHNNWLKFIRAAVTQYQDDSRVAYMRFGTGVSGESGVMAGASSDPACIARWNAAGMSYSTWLNNAVSVVDYVGSLNPHLPIFFALNKLGAWDLGDLGFATALANEAAKFGFLVGNAGFSGRYADWNAIYQAHRPMTYMQMANPQLNSRSFVTFLRAAAPLGIQVYELYARDYKAAYIDGEASVRAALEAVGTPSSCKIDVHWGE
jgi:hypothetical protein